MLRSTLRKLNPHAERPGRWRKMIIAIGLVLSLVAASGILAKRATVRPMSRPTNNQPKATTASPASLVPPDPSKEYVYIGGKLVATVEPAP